MAARKNVITKSAVRQITKSYESCAEAGEAIWLIMGGRLRPGVTVGQVNAEVAAIGAALEREYPKANRGKA